jgi:2-polyprenyl-3-methyl-5-hydroxy-6-metoxy-1,4-benzoquinol methylase
MDKNLSEELKCSYENTAFSLDYAQRLVIFSSESWELIVLDVGCGLGYLLRSACICNRISGRKYS